MLQNVLGVDFFYKVATLNTIFISDMDIDLQNCNNGSVKKLLVLIVV